MNIKKGKDMKLKDIADALHLSVSTVSKALNGAFDISKETKEMVLEYAKANNYKFRDQRLKVTSVRRLCVLIDNVPVQTQSNIIIPLTLTFSKFARLQNFEVITLPIDNIKTSYDNFMSENKFDGAFICGLNYKSHIIEEIKTTKYPTVIYDNNLTGEKVGTINTENINSISKLVSILVEHGHKKIGFIHADIDSFVANERYAGYIIGLMMNHIEYKPEFVYYGNSFSEGAGERAADYFKNLDVTAIVCAADTIAIGLLKRFKALGINVPERFSITGYDDLEISEYVDPPLSTIRQDLDSIGEKAYYLLTSLMMNRSTQSIIIPGEVVLRNSIKKID